VKDDRLSRAHRETCATRYLENPRPAEIAPRYSCVRPLPSTAPQATSSAGRPGPRQFHFHAGIAETVGVEQFHPLPADALSLFTSRIFPERRLCRAKHIDMRLPRRRHELPRRFLRFTNVSHPSLLKYFLRAQSTAAASVPRFRPIGTQRSAPLSVQASARDRAKLFPSTAALPNLHSLRVEPAAAIETPEPVPSRSRDPAK
jgi:hypothetical protein